MKKRYGYLFILSIIMLLTGCSQDRANYLDNNSELVDKELGEWTLIEKEKIQNGFESIYYNWIISYKTHENEDETIKIYAKNPYGLRYSFDKHLTDLFIEENNYLYSKNDFNIEIKSIQQTVTHDGNEYLKEYPYIYSFNKEIKWEEVLNKHHYIRIEMKKKSSLNKDELLNIKESLKSYGNVEYIYFVDNIKYKFMLMNGEEITEQALSNYYNDYRKMFLKAKFQY